MKRRELIGAMGLGAAAVAATGSKVWADDHDQHPHEHKHDDHVMLMAECAKLCNEAAAHCLNQLRQGEGTAEIHAHALEVAAGCQAFCHLSASLLASCNPLTGIAHEANAKVCDACADACERDHSAEIMKECAEKCRECADACRAMAAGEHHHKT